MSASLASAAAPGRANEPASLATVLLGTLAFLAVLLAAFHGGGPLMGVLAGAAAVAAVAMWSRILTGRLPSVAHLVQDGIVVGLLAAMVDQTARLWGVPYVWYELLRLTPLGGLAACGVYIGAVIWGMARWREHIWHRGGIFLFLLPLLFNQLLLLGSTPRIEELGWRLVLKADIGFELWRIIGRAAVLLLFTEVLVVGIGYVMDRRWLKEWRMHALILGCAVLAATTPQIADFGSTGGGWLARPIAVAATAFAFAGLWGQTFLVTGVLLDAFRNRRPSWRIGSRHWRSGAVKGAIYAGVFMALVQVAVVVAGLPSAMWLAATLPIPVGALLGAVLFPLMRTIMESFDGSAPFFDRLRAHGSNPWSYVSGVILGVGVGWALGYGLPHAAPETRFLVGLLIGAAGYAGTDLARDVWTIRQGVRHRLQDWRVYALGAGLGGIVGGALAWYLDAGQLAVIGQKLMAYGTVAQPAQAYVIYPLFSKWGSIDIGATTGGARLLFGESLSGVINWSLAAPLFSVNLVLLTALFERRLDPLRNLFSADGVTGLVEQAIRVLRWGLWMAPIIYSFLKMAPDPTWYNQDGAIRTAVAVAQSWSLSPELFRLWSLEVFLGLLAYDWLRVLIWFDHMGLRVATLVNLSFVGGDRLDERLGRWLGHSSRSRGIPEGIRRFATWAPLLIPFYIPRGAEWDQVWTGAERVASGGQPLLPAVSTLLVGYGIAAALTLPIGAYVWRHHQRRPATLRPPGPLSVANGVYTVELHRDGRGYSRALSWARPDFEIDLSRRPDDPVSLRGKLFYFREADNRPWSLGQQPLRVAGPDYEVSQTSPTSLRIVNTVAGIRAVATVEVGDARPVEIWRLRLRNLEARTRRIELTSYQELAMHAAGAYQRAPAYNGMHVGTWFVRGLGAVLAQNRLLRDAENHLSRQRMSHEVAFHAVRTGDGVELLGYEDSRPCFIGDGTLRDPLALRTHRLRDPADEGLLYAFDPVAALRVGVELPAAGEVEVLFVDGLAPGTDDAARWIASITGRKMPPASELKDVLARRRELVEPRKPIAAEPGFVFGEDGTELALTPHTGRPWFHVMASPLGHGAIVGNDGEMFSFAGNAQQNGLTPSGLDALPSQIPSQLVYVADLDSGEIECPTFVPYRRPDARYDVVFGRGCVVYRMSRGSLELELTSAVVMDKPAEVRVLRIRNLGEDRKRLRVVPYAQVALAELPQDTRWTGIEVSPEPVSSTLLFASHGNDFRRGWAFLAMSLHCEAYETMRSRFIGGDLRDLSDPCFVQFGGPDAGRRDDGLRCAALAGSLEVEPGGEALVSFVIGQTPTRFGSVELAEAYRDPPAALRAIEEARAWWEERLSVLRVETNFPAFDRLVNDWLPYQALTSRLWGRAGPSQRSGAFGFRDQLQDVMAFLPTWPELARQQILLHAGQQFVGGDVLKWWHVSWQGRTGRGERTHASDPHLWLPHVVARYIRATGDAAILDERTAFLEGEAIPPGRDGLLISPRPSREDATVYEHCRRAIELALDKRGTHGIPLMGAGDWNDGFDLVGREGRGESVWVGFFLYGILADFVPLAEKRDPDSATRWDAEASSLRSALAKMWRGDRFLRATMDDGSELAIWDALMPAWAALSGAVEPEQALHALDAALQRLERSNLIQLVEPAFGEDSEPYPGRIADYPPGVRENGGQYTHGASWLVDAFVELSQRAAAAGDHALAARHRDRAIEVWGRISPVDRYHDGGTDRYGLPPHQQPADIYFGPGYEGRGGWSWYTGSAGRMLVAAHAVLGIEVENGRLAVPDDLLAPKGALEVRRLLHRGRDVTPARPRNTA
ncbi:MAG TPA: hypothetical protein PKA13_08820 [Geminicoccaceae bacterium]|nr:hypothetical protein [Geminicoccus sp.]HMU49866.1 hypothetical protein [Geminicoccaceae bacterium]